MKIFLDANILVRLFTDNDDPKQLENAKRLFIQAEQGEFDLVLDPPVLFELAWALHSRYKIPKEQVLNILSELLSRPGLTVTDHDLAAEAIETAQQTGLEFADCYVAASGRRAEADRRHFSALPVRLAPIEES